MLVEETSLVFVVKGTSLVFMIMIPADII